MEPELALRLANSRQAAGLVSIRASKAFRLRSKGEQPDLKEHPKSPPLKLAIAARLRRETTLTTRQIAQPLHLGSWKSLNHKLYLRNQTAPQEPRK